MKKKYVLEVENGFVKRFHFNGEAGQNVGTGTGTT